MNLLNVLLTVTNEGGVSDLTILIVTSLYVIVPFAIYCVLYLICFIYTYIENERTMKEIRKTNPKFSKNRRR